MSTKVTYLLLTGGVGGAKLCDGWVRETGGGDCAIAVNTGDDFEHLGLTICPDIDTLLYTLRGEANKERGWGLADESWRVMERLSALGGDTWFQLGDRDLATHLLRTQLIRSGAPLSQVIASLADRLDISVPIFPMAEQPVRTIVETNAGALPFQDYFVRRRCEPDVQGIIFEGAEKAQMPRGLADCLARPELAHVLICPSNPFVSIAPMLAVSALRNALVGIEAPVTAVSPIVAGAALKGPAAKMLASMGYPVSALGVARFYFEAAPGLLDRFVIDLVDADQATAIEAMGIQCLVAPIVMRELEDRRSLARHLLSTMA